jgi:MFS family permease
MTNEINELRNLIHGLFFLFGAITIGLVFGFVGGYLGAMKNRSKEGFWLSFFFGPIGWILALLMPVGPEEEEESPKKTTPIKENTLTEEQKNKFGRKRVL